MAPCTTYCEKINFSWVSKLSSRCGSWYYVGKHFFFFGGGGGALIWTTKMVTIVEIIFDWFEIISVDLFNMKPIFLLSAGRKPHQSYGQKS